MMAKRENAIMPDRPERHHADRCSRRDPPLAERTRAHHSGHAAGDHLPGPGGRLGRHDHAAQRLRADVDGVCAGAGHGQRLRRRRLSGRRLEHPGMAARGDRCRRMVRRARLYRLPAQVPGLRHARRSGQVRRGHDSAGRHAGSAADGGQGAARDVRADPQRRPRPMPARSPPTMAGARCSWRASGPATSASSRTGSA